MFSLFKRKADPMRNGKWKEFNKHAILIAEGRYVNDKKHGIWREYFDDNGSLMVEEAYSHGVPDGRFISYHPNGKPLSKGEFKNGLREGVFTIYDENGSIIRNMVFFRNKEIELTAQNEFQTESTT